MNTDIIIIGGGISGLWLRALLSSMGYKCLLIDQHSWGGRQTLAAQGIVHGGTKYSFNGIWNPEARAIQDMPRRWEQALINGDGELPLKGVKSLSPHQYICFPSSNKIVSFLASSIMQSKVTALKAQEYPDSFKQGGMDARVYQLNERVIDMESLVQVLNKIGTGAMIKGKVDFHSIINREDGVEVKVNQQTIRAQLIISTAGAGNKELTSNQEDTVATQPTKGGSASKADKASKEDKLDEPIKQQLRGLNMLMLRGVNLPPIYAHFCDRSALPLLTITTHEDEKYPGETIWYVGGALAEHNLDDDAQQLAQKFIKQIAEFMPQLSIKEQEIHAAKFRIDRAEPLTASKMKPVAPDITLIKRALICYPIKMTFAPLVGDMVVKRLQQMGITPQAKGDGKEGEMASGQQLPSGQQQLPNGQQQLPNGQQQLPNGQQLPSSTSPSPLLPHPRPWAFCCP